MLIVNCFFEQICFIHFPARSHPFDRRKKSRMAASDLPRSLARIGYLNLVINSDSAGNVRYAINRWNVTLVGSSSNALSVGGIECEARRIGAK
jgi:hypothetical protein